MTRNTKGNDMHELTKQALADNPAEKFSCECCGQKLNPRTMTWLELSVAGQWAKEGGADWTGTDASQGCFPVGRACARRLLAK
jgi:hypothetical protein